MIDGNQLREEFGRYLAEHKATRWGMDAALMHVCKIAYDAGKTDGPGEHRNGAAETLDKLLTDRMKRSVKVEQVLQDVADGKRPVLTPYECRALSLSLGTPDESFSYAKAVLDTLYSQQFEIEVPDKWEYYYMDNNCPAADSGDPNCICWHDEGRGPYNNARHDDEDTFLEWRRVKAPAPADPDPLHLSRILHELAGAASLCWEPRPTGVFDAQLAIQFVEQAISEIRSRMTPAPAEAPMPKPVAYGFGNTAITGHTNRLMMVRIDVPLDDQYAGAFWLPLVLADEAHTYGVACRAAGEAAGYARGLADAGRDAERRGQFLVECNDVALRIDPFGYGIYDAIDGDGQPYQSQALADEIAAMRGEVKP